MLRGHAVKYFTANENVCTYSTKASLGQSLVFADAFAYKGHVRVSFHLGKCKKICNLNIKIYIKIILVFIVVKRLVNQRIFCLLVYFGRPDSVRQHKI